MQTQTPEIIIAEFMGFSGSGKDAQAALLRQALEKKYGEHSVLYVYTGENLRNAIKSGTYTARLIKEKVMDVGAKAPDFLAIWAWGQSFISALQEGQHILLSSSPRTLLEAKVLDDAASFYGTHKVYPIYLNVAREEAVSRLKARGRFDDIDETINARLSWFEAHVHPAIEYYRRESKNKLIEIDGNPRDPQKIHEAIKQAVGL